MKKVYKIDGNEFDTLEEFYDHISQILVPGSQWGKNLNALNDILRGGFGTPERGFVIEWRNSSRSREKLGYKETIKNLEYMLIQCHPSNRESLKKDIQLAEKGEGQTLFEILVDIIHNHGPKGGESEDAVELLLL